MDFKIYHTGSSGNCNIIKTENYTFMIDCGVPYKRIEESEIIKDWNVDFLIITHRHSDHLNVSTYNRLHREYPNIQVITNSDVQQFLATKNSHYYPDFIIESGLTIELGNLEMNFIENEHGVSTQGIVMIEYNEVLLYATDLSTTYFYEEFLNIRNITLDICLLENNYDINKLREKLEQHTGYNLAEAQSRHLEHDEYHAFVNKFTKPSCKTQELHQSSSLY